MLTWTKKISPSAHTVQKPQVKSASAIYPAEQQCAFSEGFRKHWTLKVHIEVSPAFTVLGIVSQEGNLAFKIGGTFFFQWLQLLAAKPSKSFSCALPGKSSRAAEICSAYGKTNEHILLCCQYPGHRNKFFKDMRPDVFKDKFGLAADRATNLLILHIPQASSINSAPILTRILKCLVIRE